MARTPKRNSKAPANRRGASKSAAGRRRASSAPKRKGYGWTSRLLALVFLGGVVGGVYLLYLDHQVRLRFEGKRWAIPARVYGRPLEIYAGADLTPDQLVAELARLGYRKTRHPSLPASWSRDGGRFLIRTRPFDFWDGSEPSHYFELRFSGNRPVSLKDGDGRSQAIVRLEAPEIGSLYPAHNEDRVLVSRKELPELLIQSLLAVEDRAFYTHHGMDPKAILRAIWANIRAGGVVQGGSTLTQQLVKNLYLTHERSLGRKLNEAAMALVLEARFSKDEILEAYANEIYLGQDGGRAIHGFGLASRFYFNRPLQELDLPRLALLVGMIRGPSLYDPWRNPQRAQARRDRVLSILTQQGVITESERESAVSAPLGVGDPLADHGTGNPAFLSLVRRQLYRDYREEDLTSEGLRIFTTLDPWIQQQAEQAVAERLTRLEKQHHLPAGKLEGAVVVASSDNGEILALVSGRRPGFAGFNRALDAIRPIGSLIKPVVYLAALMKPDRYTLASFVDDEPVSIRTPGGKVWTPKNYDNTTHGKVSLHEALAQSYNLATVHLGMELGLERVVGLLETLGVTRDVESVPALLLGAVSLSPLEVTQLYQTFASGGFYSPLRAIREVQSGEAQPLQRYPLTVRQAVPQGATYLLNRNLQEVVRGGTGRGLAAYLSKDLLLAGKTGTTDELRDSWFAGFSGDKVTVVWVGRDDNQSAGLTGSSGALQVWGDLMKRLKPTPLSLPRPESVEHVWIDPDSGLLADEYCPGAYQFPFLKGSAPVTRSSCMAGSEANPVDFFRRIFQ